MSDNNNNNDDDTPPPPVTPDTEEDNNNNNNNDVPETSTERVQRFLATGHAHLHASVATAVAGVNTALAQTQAATARVRAPVTQAWQHVVDVEHTVEQQVRVLYQRRHEYGPQTVGGTAAAGGLIALLRRRGPLRIASGAALAGGFAYLVVYEPIPLHKLPERFKAGVQMIRNRSSEQQEK
jgi:hypothetical protein